MNEYLQTVSILDDMLSSNRHLDDCLDERATPLIQQICYGVTRHYYYLDQVINRLVKKPLPNKHRDLRLLLMAGLYSMDHLNRPVHASVNAAVESVTSLNKAWAKGLINGVLRRYGREAEALSKQITSESIEARLNHPDWLIQMITEAWPQNPEIFDANQARAPMTLRVNTRRCSVEEYLKQLEESGITASRGTLADTAVTLQDAIRVDYLPGFSEGLVSIQDEAPQLAASLMNLSNGLVVLDACAAPGGKTCHLLEAADITLTAIDRDRKRIPQITENLERLNLSATVLAEDLENFTTDQEFDRILLDAPCSATGIIRRHPDIKLLRKKTDIDKLPNIQRVLLNKAFDLLKIGGELLYSTCSILPQENDQVITAFLESRPDVTISPLGLTASSPALVETACGIQLLPTPDRHDGFYYSRLSKVAV